jgi:hypothetical protein
MRQLLVFGDRIFKIEIPDDAKITFGPWSPPTRDERGGLSRGFNPTGTLRIYQGSKENIVALFAGVTGFRDLSLSYAEQVAVEEGASIWKDDEEGYFRESKVQRTKTWTAGDIGPTVIEEVEPEEEIPFEEPPPPKPKPRRTRKKAA